MSTKRQKILLGFVVGFFVAVFIFGGALSRVFSPSVAYANGKDTVEGREDTRCERGDEDNYFEIDVRGNQNLVVLNPVADVLQGVKGLNYPVTHFFGPLGSKDNVQFIPRCVPLQIWTWELGSIDALRRRPDGTLSAGEVTSPDLARTDDGIDFPSEGERRKNGGGIGIDVDGRLSLTGEISGGSPQRYAPNVRNLNRNNIYRFNFIFTGMGERSDGRFDTERRTVRVYLINSPLTAQSLKGVYGGEENAKNSMRKDVDGMIDNPDNFNFSPDTRSAFIAPASSPVLSNCVKADINRDGQVDIADLVRVARWFGNTVAPGAREDVNQDGKVDIIDLVMVGREFGKACGTARISNQARIYESTNDGVALRQAQGIKEKKSAGFASILKSIFWVGVR